MVNLCEYCTTEFSGRIAKQRFCSPKCQGKHYNRRAEIREKYRIRIREYRKTHPEWREKHRILQAKYAEKYRARKKQYYQREDVKLAINERNKWRRKNDAQFAIADRLRRSLRHALEKYSDKGKVMSSRKYGLDWRAVINNLKPFPTPLEDFEIDHIIPLHSFDLEDINQVKLAFSLGNLRWLTRSENRKKGGKLRYYSTEGIFIRDNSFQ